MPSRRDAWQAALPCEIAFWDQFIASEGLEWGTDYRNRISAETPLQKEVVDRLSHLEQAEFSILDVGAGPLTMLGKSWPGRTIRITAVDPLADEYARLLSRHNITPLVPTVRCEGEEIAKRFPANSFDLVWAQNSLDHSYDPAAIIEQALTVVKIGCFVVLTHRRNEGENEAYAGLHQWNFAREKGRFVIWNKNGSIDMTWRLRRSADLAVDEDGGWVTVAMRKRKPGVVHRALETVSRTLKHLVD